MSVHSQHTRGQLVYYDTQRQRLLDAIGGSVVKWELNAVDLQAPGTTGTDPRGYITTVVELGTASSEMEASSEAGFVAQVVTDNLDNDGINVQLVGRGFRLAGNRDVYFGFAIQADEVTQSDFLVGLCVPTTDALGAGMTDGIFFRKLDGTDAITAVTEKDSVQTTSAGIHTWVANTTVALECYCTGLNVAYYVNGTFIATHNTNVPDDETLSPVIQWLAGSATAKRMKIAWARALSLG